jgi:phosphoenolpyruvate-protein phosphotransferase
VTTRYASQLEQLTDTYLAARSDDVREVGLRVVRELQGQTNELVLQEPAILVAHDLSPAELAGLDARLLQAIITEEGSVSSHLAIVAQSLGIPAVVGTTDALAQIPMRSVLVVDGTTGLVTVDPAPAQRTEAQQRLASAEGERQRLGIYRERPGLTADGVHVEVFANIGSLAEARKAIECGAEGVGLLRTELLATQGLPSEELQYQLYTEIAQALGKALIVRTFDIGGDKSVPGLSVPPEANPFLGWRGIRLALDRPAELFFPQIRALLRAALDYDIRIMLPMIAAPQEVEEARALLEQAQQDLRQAGYPSGKIPLGIMVETPAAALTLDQFVGLVDFVSLGTNDLVQYTYAVDRTNPHVSKRAQPLGLATLRLIAQVCQAAAGIPVAVCGQMAADPAAIPLLVGLGVRELSVAPVRVPAVKQQLSTLTLQEMQARASNALALHHEER